MAKLAIEVVLLMPNLVRVETYFNFGLPAKDPDDQKFTDCAIACGAAFLVTEDRDFLEVKKTPFPLVNIISPKAFRAIFLG
ncbi:MAG: PIN domain-containing protein [Saprospiraceae bacterium]|nr:PIN domain-containing protein [Saprospiraceae bacterium]